MVLGFEKEISSGINGVACGEPWNRLKPKRESSGFQASNRA